MGNLAIFPNFKIWHHVWFWPPNWSEKKNLKPKRFLSMWRKGVHPATMRPQWQRLGKAVPAPSSKHCKGFSKRRLQSSLMNQPCFWCQLLVFDGAIGVRCSFFSGGNGLRLKPKWWEETKCIRTSTLEVLTASGRQIQVRTCDSKVTV